MLPSTSWAGPYNLHNYPGYALAYDTGNGRATRFDQDCALGGSKGDFETVEHVALGNMNASTPAVSHDKRNELALIRRVDAGSGKGVGSGLQLLLNVGRLNITSLHLGDDPAQVAAGWFKGRDEEIGPLVLGAEQCGDVAINADAFTIQGKPT